MPSHLFEVFGKNTLEVIPVGDGSLYRRKWLLRQHPGPRLNLKLLGGHRCKMVYLYKEHLEILYARFALENPAGFAIELDGAYEEKWLPAGVSPRDIDALYDKREIFVNLIYTDDDLGYPHLKRYLPEIFDASVVSAMGEDPWLDADMLYKAIGKGVLGSKSEDGLPQHLRWSEEWRAYCRSYKISQE